MKNAIVLRHVPFENLGSFEKILLQQNYQILYKEVPSEALNTQELLQCDLLIILGGPISANDHHAFSFITTELAILERRMRQDQPTFGICLGAQLMAKALGGQVFAGREREIGWVPLQLTEEGKRSPLQFLDASLTHVFHWHGEVFMVPPGAVNLASTPACDSQAFSYGKKCLALQFHPEIIPSHLESWYVGHTLELALHKISIESLRAKSQLHGKTLLPAAKVFFSYWLESLEDSVTTGCGRLRQPTGHAAHASI